MGLADKHKTRDLNLPKVREDILNRAISNLSQNPDVLAIYLAGSLARGDSDKYSDIDLHTIVKEGKIDDFLKQKKELASKWGNVLFYEAYKQNSPVLVTHYNCFVKVDSWYHPVNDISKQPSIWLKDYQVLYDPDQLITSLIEESTKLTFQPSGQEVLFWREKTYALFHETYRAAMRGELYLALQYLDNVRWHIVWGWYMNMNEHLNSPYKNWSKLDGKHSKLSQEQLNLLTNWNCTRSSNEILRTIQDIKPYFRQLNRELSNKVKIDTDEKTLNLVLQLI